MAAAPKSAKGGISPTMPVVVGTTARAALEASNFAKGGQYHMIPVENIHVIPGFNPRIETPDYLVKLGELAGRIEEQGFLNTKPLAGFPGKLDGADVIYVTDGHRRLAAVKKLNAERAEREPPEAPIEALPLILKPGETDMKALTIALMTENSGEKLSALEQAIVVRRLLKADMKAAEIAKALKIGDKWVGQLIMLVNGPKVIRDLVRAGKIKGSEAIRIMSAKREKAKDDAGAVIKGKFTYEKAEEEITKIVKRAEEKGGKEAKATRKDTDEGTKGGTAVAGVKMATTTIEFVGTAKSKHEYSDIARFVGLFDDLSWFKKTNAAGTKIMLLEDVKFSAKISRPKKEETADAPAKKGKEADADADAAPDTPAADDAVASDPAADL